jgi:hypothetical protein
MQFIKNAIFEQLNEQKIETLVEFLSDKKFKNPRSKMFLYHGTRTPPERFNLRDDYDWEESNVWSGDLPEGYLFLTTDIKEAKAYGKYVIPCELYRYDSKKFNVKSFNPSRDFDMDYGIDLYAPDKYYGFWEKFQDSGKSSLVITGYNGKSTVITEIQNVIPRTDLASEFYNSTEKTLAK